MQPLFEQIQACCTYIQQRTDFQPRFGLILGTGLSGLADEIAVEHTFLYKDLPHFPVSTVQSHKGQLILGDLAGVPIVAMAGRFHHYEGYSMQQVTFPVRVMKQLGIERLLISNAAGSVNEHFREGSLVFINDHINLQPQNPLRGPNDERLGPRFPDMLHTYDKEMLGIAMGIAQEHNIEAHEGVYVGVAGPNLETPAEYHYLRLIGGDVIGMSTVPEVLVARHMGLPVFVASVVSNLCYPISALTETTVEEVIAVVEQAAPKLQLVFRHLLLQLAQAQG